jgi:hypothetical protein|tara:strand:- start:490 stop:810 length:321 start_codon:yes stop_codon:yes gene_type:complete
MTQKKEENLTSDTKFSLSIKEIIAAAIGFSSLIGMYFTLQAQIQTAMELPKPEIQKVEFEYKDKLIRSTIEKIDADVTTVKEDVNEIKNSLEKMDERLYEMSKKSR